ncbi:hypothetical protein [Leadbettera azotonutricia]|uniref:Uncharacterized protein n=1 Tax=Leadbettera azotonutricia (strain ATCC BAA-888 / DSM 13862 / ZAS-9) TaxID=545695 RepID=F5Y9V1_LEAAZ|nr:hypothetical protein [Leadbettera azotonutricia]AEF80931.1 hypothetical protein TREAZ_3168 [Leadbettera azotonutricia ZAS-9]
MSGAQYDPASDTETFNPQVCQDDFHCFYSNGKHWGMLHQVKSADGKVTQKVEVLG